jgi:glc operon protein GlcG
LAQTRADRFLGSPWRGNRRKPAFIATKEIVHAPETRFDRVRRPEDDRCLPRRGSGVSIAIVDDGGHLLKFERMDGAGLGTIEAAIQKAKSAALFDGTTKALEDLVLARLTFLNLPGYVPVQGGVPVKIGEDCIGGIGVSGVPSQCDEQIASAGLTVLD